MSIVAVLLTVLAAGAMPPGDVTVSLRNGTKLIDFVADGRFNAPPEKVLAVMLDYEHSAQWQKNLRESRVLDRGANALDVYQRLKLPIVADCDYTLHVTWKHDDHGISILFALANDLGPSVTKGVVRVRVHEGSWRLEHSADGKSTQAHYQVRMDLGGCLPSGMVRRRAAANMPDFFDRIRHRL